jgi:hypothetical protein
MFEPETKRAASVVQIVFGRTEAGWLPVLESGRRRDARGSKRFGPEANINTLSQDRRPRPHKESCSSACARKFGVKSVLSDG